MTTNRYHDGDHTERILEPPMTVHALRMKSDRTSRDLDHSPQRHDFTRHHVQTGHPPHANNHETS